MITLSDAIISAKAGRHEEARAILSTILANEPYNVSALLWMTQVVDTMKERRKYLNRVLAIDSSNVMAQRGIALLDKRENALKPKTKWHMSRSVKILTFLFLTPIWTLIVLDDPDSTLGVKVLATILLVMYVLLICPHLIYYN